MPHRRRIRARICLLALHALTAAAAIAQAPARPAFDAASIRESKSGGAPFSSFPLTPGPQYNAQGGLLVTRNMQLLQLVVFAYARSMYQVSAMRSQLPEWTRDMRFDVQARADGNPSKDDMRAMMRTLLEDRFNLKAHYEPRERTVYALTVLHPGKLGSGLQPHPANAPPCSAQAPEFAPPGATPAVPTVAGDLPAYCGAIVSMPGAAAGEVKVAGRAISPSLLALSVGGIGETDRPVIDSTGLTGTFDVKLSFSPASSDPARAFAENAPTGPTLSQALREQWGIRMTPTTGKVEAFVLDHIDKPSEN